MTKTEKEPGRKAILKALRQYENRVLANQRMYIKYKSWGIVAGLQSRLKELHCIVDLIERIPPSLPYKEK